MADFPVPALRWDLTPQEITSGTTTAIATANATLDAVASTPSPSWASVLGPLAALDRDLEARVAAVTFLKDVAVDEAVRAASAAAQSALSAWEIAAGLREDVYVAVKKAAAALDPAALDAEAARFLERTLRDYRRRGLDLDPAPRARLADIRTAISELCVRFQQTLGEWTVTLSFSPEELAGLPADFLDGLDDDAASPGKKVVTLSYPHVVPILKQCTVPGTREAVERAFNSRGHPSNTALLSAIVTLRRYAAHILGFPTHASFVLEERMAKTPEAVHAFLVKLGKDLAPAHAADLAALLARKAAEDGAGVGGGGGEKGLTMANYRYYQEKDLQGKYEVDHELIKGYFPLPETLVSMFDVYQRILSVKFTRLPSGAVPTWHEDVAVYAVHDDTDDASGEPDAGAWASCPPSRGELLGYFYLDLHPRPGKYTHAAVFPILSGCAAGDVGPSAEPAAAGARVLPLCAMVCNFTRGAGGSPSLLRHEEVETLFHEFGHVMHHLLSRTRLHRFASFRCEADFVEAPSQMLEEWVWDPVSLPLLSGHHSETDADGKPKRLPKELVGRLSASRMAHTALLNTRQVFLALFDYTLHALPAVAPPEGLDLTPLLPKKDGQDKVGEGKGAESGAGAALASSSPSSSPGLPPSLAAVLGSAVETERVLADLHETLLHIPMTPGTNFAASFGHLVGGYDSAYYGYLYSEVFANDMAASRFAAAKDGMLDRAEGMRYRRHILAPGGARDAMDSLRTFLGRDPSNEAFLKLKGLL